MYSAQDVTSHLCPCDNDDMTPRRRLTFAALTVVLVLGVAEAVMHLLMASPQERWGEGLAELKASLLKASFTFEEWEPEELTDPEPGPGTALADSASCTSPVAPGLLRRHVPCWMRALWAPGPCSTRTTPRASRPCIAAPRPGTRAWS